MIAYHVSVPAPHTQKLHVEVTFDVQPGAVSFAIPAWTPGSYLLREFARYLSEPTVEVAGESVACAKVAKGTWTFTTASAGTATVRYEVHAAELTVRTPHVDSTHAYFVGTNALVYVLGREDGPHAATVDAPDGWRVFCALDADGERFVAPNYDVIADAPFELGPHRTHTFDVRGASHRFVFWGDDAIDIDIERLERDVRALVEHNADIFDGELPYTRYDFVFHITATARGGLEHLNSTVLATPWRFFETDDGYDELLGLISHEHFHTWNVKRIRPRALGPFDYQNENHSGALWVVEGFTSYFDNLVCARSGVFGVDRYLEALAKDVKRYLGTPGRAGQSLQQSSWDAWIRLYRPDADTPNRTVSYYLKGALISLVLDLHIRAASGGTRSLIDVMRRLWRDTLETGVGYDEATLPALISEAVGQDVSSLVESLTATTDDPDFAAALATHGLTLSATASKDPWLGLVTETIGGDLAVKTTLSGGPAHASDLCPGDRIIALGGRRVSPKKWAGAKRCLTVGQPVEVHAFRRDRLFTCELTPGEAPATDVKIERNSDATPEQRRLNEIWLGQPWPTKDNGR